MASTRSAEHVVTLFHANGCHLCESARRVIEGVRAEIPFELEARYRERIPVVLVDGEEAFTYFVTPDGLRRRVGP